MAIEKLFGTIGRGMVPCSVEVNGRDKVLPWVDRTENEWQQYVSKKEAVRLFYLASLNGDGQAKAPFWVDQWYLRTPLGVYWGDNVPAMISDLEKAQSEDRCHAIGVREDRKSLAESAIKVFEDPQLYPYMMATHFAIRVRNSLRTHSTTPLTFDFNEHRARILGANPNGIEDLQKRYQNLVEIFYPSIKRYAHYKASRSRLDRDEWEGIAGVNLALAVSNFYWETIVIDSEWTVSRFLKSAFKSLQNPMECIFDTRTLEVPIKTMDRYGSSHDTEAEVLQNLSEQRVNELIRGNALEPKDVEVLSLRIFHNLNYPQIAKEVGLSEGRVIQIVHRFRTVLEAQAEGGDLNVPSAPKKEAQGKPFWDNLFSNLDKYRAQFEQKKAMLKPFHELMVEKFFALQTGDRDTTVQAIWQSFQDAGWSITADTVRRAINAGINQLDFREKPDSRVHGQLSVGWSRHQQARLVSEVTQDPDIWNSFTARRRYILKRYFIEGQGRKITAAGIADELGLHESTVSREINKAIREIYRIRGNTRYRRDLADKPRNLLPV